MSAALTRPIGRTIRSTAALITRLAPGVAAGSSICNRCIKIASTSSLMRSSMPPRLSPTTRWRFSNNTPKKLENSLSISHLCYTAPHFPLHALDEDVAKYRGKYRDGWDQFCVAAVCPAARNGIAARERKAVAADPVAQAWADVPDGERDEWDLRMAVYAAMIDRMDQGIGRVLAAVEKLGATDNTLVMFLSDNGASAERT